MRGLHVVDRAPLRAPAQGTSPLVVIVHGAMDRASSFGRVALRLPDAGIVTYDRRGYAASSGLGAGETFADQVADLVGVLGGRRAVAVGHSFGGAVVLAAAQLHPELVCAAVVFEPPASWEPWWPGTTLRAFDGADPAAAAEAFMRRMVGDRVWDRLPPSTRDQRRAEGVTLRADLTALGVERPYDPAAIDVPVVVGWGTASPAHLRRAAMELVAAVPGAEGVEVEGSSHGVHLTHPDALAALVRRAIALAAPQGWGNGAVGR